jgi:gliding motility-associated-like protein
MRKNVSSIQKKSLAFCFTLFSMLLLSLNSYSQFTATWNLRAAPAKTSTVTGVQAANVTAGSMDPGAAFIPNGSHNNDGFRCQPGSGNWPNVITAGFYLDFPLSPANNLIANITSITFTARTSGSSGNNIGKFQYQANGSGPWTDLGNNVVIPGGGSNNLTLNGLNAPFVTGNTYIIRMNIFAEGTNTSASRSVFIRDLVINGNTIIAGPPPTVLTTTATPTAQSTATVGGNLTDIGLSPMIRSGICWSTTINPTITNNFTTNGPLTPGTFTGNLTGLQANTQYFARAYATNLVGTSYGDNVTFTTLPPIIPTLTTTPATTITGLSANSGGTITYDGAATITAKGVCWATTSNPTIANNITTNGNGNAPFTSQLALLAPNTTYFVRAYATNSVGTGYGNEISFTTPASSPTIIAIPSNLAFGDVTINSNSVPQSFAVTAISLTPASGNVTLTAPTHYQISLSANGPFSTTLNLPYTGGTLATTTVYVRFSPTIYGTLNGTLSIAGGGAPNISVALTGKGVQSPNDFSNKGTDFWVGYANHEDMYSNATTINSNGGSQRMNLYFTSDQNAVVNVTIPGLGYTSAPIAVAANTVTIFQLPNTIGSQYAQLYQEGKSAKGIHITSDIPIVAYAHIYANYVSAAAMLLPTTTWGTDYNTFNYNQNSSANSTSFNYFFVIANEDNTVVEITPTNNSLGGLVAGNTFTVTLNQGEVYNVLAGQGSDFTGSRIKTIDCNKKIAVFSGSGRTDLAPCSGTSSDNLFQQSMPKAAWGTKYLTSRTEGTVRNNIYRIGVSDPLTVVRINGQALPNANYPAATLQKNYYYQIEDSIPLVITADKPISIAQYVKSSNGCTNPDPTANFGRFNGDPEMIFISPVEQAIDKAILYSSSQQDISFHYINVIIPTIGVSTFRLDGVNVSSKFKPHTEPGYSYATLDSLNGNRLQAGQHVIESTQPFNAIAYGFGDNNSRNSDPPRESYGYNAGTQLKDLTQNLFVQNPYAISNEGKACKDVNFKFRVTLPYPSVDVSSLTWNFNNSPNLLPSSSTVTQTNPTSDSTFTVNGKSLYVYSLPTQYTFNAIGVYTVRIIANVTDLTGCSGLKEYTFDVQVVDGVIANFNTTNNLRVCLNDSTRFVDASNGQGFPLTKWQWNFGNSTIDSVKNPVRFLSPAGNYSVSLRAINSLGCYADVTKTVSVLTLPTANFTHNAPVCLSNAIAFNSSTSNGGGGTINNWVWNFGDNTTAAAQNPSKTYTTANTFTVKLNVTTADGCKDSTTRTVAVLPVLTAPVVVTGTITANSIQFNWAAVTGAVGYEISVDGSGFTSPSSGATGLSHVVNGLQPNQTVNITVRALGTLPCQSATGTASGTTLLPDVGIFVPNTFTPNGDGRNDIVRVYGNYIKSLNFQIYNQWGEKVFETNDVNGGWNGMYKNKPQPVGVYVYVLRVENTNGEIVNKRGSINLIK